MKYYIIFLFSFSLCCLIVHGAQEVKVVAGAFIQNLPNITLYQANLPILFHLSDSLWSTLNKCRATICNASFACDYLSSQYSLFFNINSKLLEHPTTNNDLLNVDGDTFGWGFQIADREHVRHLYGTETEMASLYDHIVNYNFSIIFHSLPDPLSLPYADQCSRNLELGIFDTLFHRERTRAIIQMCHTRKLYPDIIPMPLLKTQLERLSVAVEKDGYTLALRSLAEYYSLPLVDCFLSPTRGLLGLSIPLIRRENVQVSLQRLITPPFAWNSLSCSMDLRVLDIAVSNLTGPDSLTILRPHCNPFHSRLCLITESYDENILSILCARRILTGGSAVELARICPMTCRNTGSDFPFITSFDTNKFLITHAPEGTLIFCRNRTIPVENSDNIGAIMVTLPCGCEIYLNNHTVIKPTYPCITDRPVQLSHFRVIPALWSTLKSISIPPITADAPTFTDLHECVNRNWDQTTEAARPASITSQAPLVLSVVSFLFSCLALIVLSCMLLVDYRRRATEAYAAVNAGPPPADLLQAHGEPLAIDRPPMPVPRPVSDAISCVTDKTEKNQPGYLTPIPGTSTEGDTFFFAALPNLDGDPHYDVPILFGPRRARYCTRDLSKPTLSLHD